jgi:hypothetical protein
MEKLIPIVFITLMDCSWVAGMICFGLILAYWEHPDPKFVAWQVTILMVFLAHWASEWDWRRPTSGSAITGASVQSAHRALFPAAPYLGWELLDV